MTEIIAVICLGALGWLGFVFYRNRGPAANAGAATAAPGIEDLRPGAVLALSRVGPELKDFDVRIVGRHRYREGGFQWTELEGEAADGPVWIEVERDDELSVSIALRRLDLRDVGLDPQALDVFVRADEGRIEADGGPYEYEDHGRAEFLRNGDPARVETVAYWDFESADGRRYLSVERWSNDDYQVHLGEALSPGQIEIYSRGEGEEAHHEFR